MDWQWTSCSDISPTVSTLRDLHVSALRSFAPSSGVVWHQRQFLVNTEPLHATSNTIFHHFCRLWIISHKQESHYANFKLQERCTSHSVTHGASTPLSRDFGLHWIQHRLRDREDSEGNPKELPQDNVPLRQLRTKLVVTRQFCTQLMKAYGTETSYNQLLFILLHTYCICSRSLCLLKIWWCWSRWCYSVCTYELKGILSFPFSCKTLVTNEDLHGWNFLLMSIPSLLCESSIPIKFIKLLPHEH